MTSGPLPPPVKPGARCNTPPHPGRCACGAADPGGINMEKILVLKAQGRIHRIPGGPGDGTDNNPFLAEEGIDQR